MENTHSIEEGDDLVVKRKGGGSIIDQRPLFSNDGELLYIISKQTVKAYNAQTGDFVRNFEIIDYKIVGIVTDPDNSSTIIGCTYNGELNYWDCPTGIIIKKLPLKIERGELKKIKTFHIVNYQTAKGNNFRQALLTNISKNNDEISLFLFDLDSGYCVKSTTIRTESSDYYVDVIGNYGQNLIAVIHDSDLHILNPARNLVDKLHKTGRTGRLPTCIAGHPEEECVATGDSTGRVVVWRSLFQTRPLTAVFHWHTLPVTEIAFSVSGGHMYTGGGECVLVKWTLNNSRNKSFLPRLPAPIKHLTIAPNNLYVAVSTLDNGIVVVNPQRKLTSVIQNFTWGITLSSKDSFPAGLIVDPRTNSLVLNSRTGHIQFFDTHNKNLLYNIDITTQNFLTQERGALIVNTEVTKVAINYNGTWMATVEERNAKTSFIEVRLKFWNFCEKEQMLKLNTSIEFPHEIGVNALKFQPNSLSDDDGSVVAVTTGKDKKFKLWYLSEPASTDKTKQWNVRYRVKDYKKFSANDADFAVDGSLVGIGFDCHLTLWNPDDCTYRECISHLFHTSPISHIKFGNSEVCHLVVVGSADDILVWDLSTLRLRWYVPLNLATLTADPNSVYMAAFTTDNNLFVFSPASSTLVYEKKNIIEEDSMILGACFVPHLKENQTSSFNKWQKKSQLYFLDSNQELLTLEPESEVSLALKTLSSNSNIATAFMKLKADQASSNKEEYQSFNSYEQFGYSGEELKRLLSVPFHTLPPVRTTFLPMMISMMKEIDEKKRASNNRNNSNASRNNDSGNRMEMETSSDEEDDTEVRRVSVKEEEASLNGDFTSERDIKCHSDINFDFLNKLFTDFEGE